MNCKIRNICVISLLLLLFVGSVRGHDEDDVLYNRNFFELDETSYDIGEIPEEGAVTMAFVFDVTGSMYDDLVQVIEGAVRILDTVLHRKDRLLHNFVLVPFHDPDVGPATVTTDHQVFLRHLRDLYVQGGGDCPEASVAAIKLALEVCLPNSFVYVFTDASSKDYYLLEDVLKLIQRKQSQVVFVMTGDCGDPTHPGYQAYERIASTSSGQVFLLKKSDVEEVLNFVQVSVQARKVNLLAVDSDKGKETNLSLVVDTNLKEFTVSLSGDNPNVQLVDPLGIVVDETSGLKDLLNLSNVQVVNVKDPKSGTWNVRVESNSSHTVRATGLSPVDFEFGFSVRPTTSLRNTYHRPLKGSVTFLLINATDLPDVAFFETVELVSLSGTSLITVPLTVLNPSLRGMYNATPFIPPDEFFYLKIIGYDEFGLPMERISPTAISSQLPEVPEVILRVPQDVHYGNTVQLDCHVQSLVPFTVRWSRGTQSDHFIGSPQSFPQTSQVVLTLTNVTSDQEDSYRCVATNIAGSSSANAFLDVREPPPFVDELNDLNVEPGSRVIFVCTARSSNSFNLTWARYDQSATRRRFSTDLVLANPRFQDHGNGTLFLEDVTPTDEGWYRCTATNEGGSAHRRMYLSVIKRPRVIISTSEATIISGTSLTVICESEGIPKPDIEWLRNGQLVKDSRHIRISGGTLQVIDAGIAEEGTYECWAHNSAGSDSRAVRIKYLEPPVISKEHDTIRSLLGHTVTLPCKVNSDHSTASVSWTGSDRSQLKGLRHSQANRGDLLLQETGDDDDDDNFIVLDDGGLRFRVDLTDAGQYICTAQNEAGKDDHIVSLVVLVPPSKPVIPTTQIPITVLVGSKYELNCWSSGYPTPIIKWFKDEVLLEDATKKIDPNDIESSSLLFPSVKLNDSGVYSCVATNEAGQSTSDHIQVVVNDPPRIDKSDHEKNLDVIVGHDVVFSCKATGHPSPVVSWQKDSVSLEPSNLILYLNGSMVIRNAQPDDSGLYRCTASNDVGYDHRDMRLTVLVPPFIDPSALHMRPEVLEGEKAVLSCPVAASPPPIITWLKDDVAIVEKNGVTFKDGGRELVITSANVNDTGNYICTALNSAGATKSVVALDVLVKPKFSDDAYEADVAVLEHQRLELECRVEGNPIPNIHWTWIGGEQGSHLPEDAYAEDDDSVSYLAIDTIQRQHSGVYVCKATNKVSSDERKFYVSVVFPPQLVGSEHEVRKALLGDEVTLECLVESHPTPIVDWSKVSLSSNQPFSDQNVRLSEDNQTLTFNAVTTQDAGEYKCQAKNQAGMVTKRTTLDVIVPPKIEESNETKVFKVLRGSSVVNLNCVVQGSTDSRVDWLKDGNFTSAEHGSSSFIEEEMVVRHLFTLEYVNNQHDGRYTCTASNEAGFDSKDFVVEVMVPPHILLDSNDNHIRQAKVGSSVQLDCPATGHPKPLMIWLKGDLHLEQNGHYEVSNEGHRLIVFNIGRDQAGVYKCVADNEAGRAQTEFQLEVLVPPSIITPLSGRDVGTPQLKAVSDEKLVIECPVKGNPFPTIEWLKDGVPITKTNNQLIDFQDEKQTLVIGSVLEQDAGRYTCVATNTVGFSERHFQVEVQQIPKLEIDVSKMELNVSVLLHRPVTLHCPVSGNPTPDIIWKKNGNMVSVDENVVVSDNGRKLMVQNTRVEDHGRYTCYAINEVGETVLDYDVDVKAPPTIDGSRVKPTLKAVENDSMVIECPADGYPQPIVTWLKDGQILQIYEGSGYSTENGSRVLVVKHLNVEHAGQYTCIASNEAGATEQNFKLNVQVPPKLETTEKGEEPNVLLHRPLVIYCPVVGIPPPSVTWFKNGQPVHILSDPNIIQSYDGKRLKLRRAQIEDAATYKCVAVNEVGRTEQEFQVSVHVAPKILQNDKGQYATEVEVSEGEIVQLECRAIGSPEPTIIWLKNGHLIGVLHLEHNDVFEDFDFDEVQHDDHFEILNDGQFLNIVGPHIEDGGRYTCVASNVAGTTERNFDLEILVRPKIIGPLAEEKRTLLNRPVNLECSVEANPPPSSIIWLKDGQPVNGLRLLGGGRQLYLNRVLRTDAGHYTCVAENSVGRAEKSFKLDVLVPPMILPSKRKHVATAGQSFTLDCLTTGHPKPTVVWLKDEALITETDIEEMKLQFHDNNQRLEVRNATVLDSGHFTCMVSNEAGIDEEHYQVEITAPPLMKLLKPTDRFVSSQLNQQRRFECPIASDVPVTITWYKNGILLNASDDPFVHLSSDSQSLQLVRARREDAASYECVATNSAGEARTDFHLEVFVPPKIESPLGDDQGNHHIVKHRPADFECYISGHPEPTVKWLKDGQTIVDVERNKLFSNGQHLRIDSVEVTDTGQYTCVATNSAGSTERDFYLAVQVPPSIDRTMDKDHIVIVSNSITLPCLVNGVPEPTISWSRNGVTVDQFNTSNVKISKQGLTIQRSRKSDAGQYTCSARNMAGEDQLTHNLNVYSSPVIDRSNTGGPTLVILNHTLVLECSATGHPLPIIKWAKDGQSLDETSPDYRRKFLSDGQILHISMVVKMDEGRYECVALNNAGQDTVEQQVDVLVPPKSHLSHSEVRNVQVIKGEETTLSCPINGDPSPNIIWIKNGQMFDPLQHLHWHTNEEHSTLKLLKAQEVDKGRYTCVGSNAAGDYELDTDLEVLVPPTIKKIPDLARIQLVEGLSLTLDCLPNGQPLPEVTWLHDGVPLTTSSSNVRLTHSGHRLRLESAQRHQGGNYTCVATSFVGVARHSFAVVIIVPPTINSSLLNSNPSVVLHDNITLTCPISGSPFPKVVWYHKSNLLMAGGDVLLSDRGTNLTITDVLQSHQGTYSCLASNDGGKVDANILLTVWIPPKVVGATDGDDPIVVPVVAKQSVLLECNLKSGFPSPTVTWMKNYKVLTNDLGGRLIVTNKGQTLNITHALRQDEDLYTCIVENEAGVTEKEFQLDVMIPPEMDVSGPISVNSLDVIEGEPLLIECPISGDPPPMVTWLKNREPLVASDRLQILKSDRVIYYENSTVTESADYTCVATNEAGVHEMDFAVRVQVPPTMLGNGLVQNVSVVVHRPLRLECPTIGTPQPDVHWTKGGHILNTSTMDSRWTNGRILQFHRVSSEHRGEYVCTATNVAGSVSKVVNVAVFEPPQIANSSVAPYQDILRVVGEEVVLSCEITGYPTPHIVWYKGDQPLHIGSDTDIDVRRNSRELLISEAKFEDSALYRCVASNVAGNVSRTFKVEIAVPPKINGAEHVLTNRVVLNQRVDLSCVAFGHPLPTVFWSRNGSTLSEIGSNHYVTDDGTLTILAAQLQDDGTYLCHAVNDAGSATRPSTIRVMVPPTILDGPSNVAIVEYEDAVLPCRVKGIPHPNVSWSRDGEMFSANLSSSGSMLITNASVEHSGTYTCTAWNAAGTESVQRHLRVNVPPSITLDQPSNYSAVRGEDVVLGCQSQGIPVPQTVWEWNGEAVDLLQPRYALLSDGGLKILNVQAYDTGSYVCNAYNTAGTDRQQLQLVVMTPPKIKSITNRPSNGFVVTQGASVHFLCLVEGYPTPEITWMRDGLILSRHANFELHRVKVADDGQYVCLAVNDAGREHKEVTLVVQVPPTLVTLPTDKQVAIGKVTELTCEADGIPIPTIAWHHNGTPIPGHNSANGLSVLKVHVIHREDGGTYTCVATNDAGEKHTDVNLKVLVPPKIIRAPGSHSVHRGASLVLPCDVEGDPIPSVFWTKDGHRVTKNDSFFLKDGWLLLENVQPLDAGVYKCIATNPVGIVEGQGSLSVLEEISFVVTPRDAVAILGDSILLDCVAQGNPKPTIKWTKEGESVDQKNVLLLSNSSLQIYAVQVNNEGTYSCNATNELGFSSVAANLTVMVNGGWSSWSKWSPCSTSCGLGTEARQRVCDNPHPRNGGINCLGDNHESRSCQLKPCPVSGAWSGWQSWSDCSISCGRGSRSRFRLCDAPAQAHDGIECPGAKQEHDVCYNSECPVHGEWGEWTLWSECSVSCGIGLRKRSRQCDNPAPLYGGRNCDGFDTETTECQAPPCEVHGQWGPWSVWSSCSRSCAGGQRVRQRLCDSPVPLNGGHNCTGQHIQTDYCNNDPCPIHGNWGSWSSWGECSASCNGGQRRRFRTCNNPEPSHGGRLCVGPGQDTEACGAHNCPEHGRWSSWNNWSQCSASCGRGTRKRHRSCSAPRPTNGGKLCPGDPTQVEGCSESSCQRTRLEAFGNILGVINGLEFGLLPLRANISLNQRETFIEATISNVTQEPANSLRILVSMLSSIYWTMAHEADQAVNGYTLTNGYFLRDTQVTFATGETLKMSQVSQGMDGSRGLLVDVVVNGDVPELPHDELIRLDDFTEDYVQMRSNTLYAQSTRTFHVSGYTLPYAWNHTIRYDEDREVMPYLVEKLRVGAIRVNYDSVNEELAFAVSASITKGSPSNECPVGFLLDVDGHFCEDVDECFRKTTCSHGCSNSLGSYSCSCPSGYTLGPNGHNCQDLDECQLGLDNCYVPEECENTIGSFRCLATCEPGYHKTTTGLGCHDIDECKTQPQVCDQRCLNLMGGYRCDCHVGFRLIGKSKCIDIDECDQMEPPCSHRCINSFGSYNCECPDGFVLSNGRQCDDIDECLTGKHECNSEQDCKNTVGGFHCFNPCPSGFAKHVNGTCGDVDECNTGLAMCHLTQFCENTRGSYHCVCPQGYQSIGRGQPCKDFNECLGDGICQHECENTVGSYVCHCPPGYKLNGNGRNCEDIDECIQEDVKCNRDEICFNTRGGYHCVEAPCPALFEREPINGDCILPCDRSDVPCPLGVKYAESLAYKTVSLASGIRPYQDLIRLAAYNENGKYMPSTLFAIAEDAEGRSLFKIRQNGGGGKGVLYTVKTLDPDVNYETKVVATSFDINHTVVYKTNFIVFISVSEFPY